MEKAYPAKMRLSQGSRSSFCAAGPVSLAPSPRPPYLVVVGSEVRRYESYCRGQFWLQTFGSIVSSVTSTIRTKGCLASCLRSKMFVSSASRITLRPAMPKSASSGSSQVRHLAMSGPSAAGAVPGGGVAVKTIEAPVRPARRVGHGIDEALVTAHAVHANDVAVVRSDLDRLLEVLQSEGSGVAKAVVCLGHPLREARVRQMALDARRGVPVPALEPAVVLVVHDVAVHARARVGGQVREAVRVDERERADPDGDTQQAGEEKRDVSSLHSRLISFPPAWRSPGPSPRPG